MKNVMPESWYYSKVVTLCYFCPQGLAEPDKKQVKELKKKEQEELNQLFRPVQALGKGKFVTSNSTNYCFCSKSDWNRKMMVPLKSSSKSTPKWLPMFIDLVAK
jgi:hypothetical protein